MFRAEDIKQFKNVYIVGAGGIGGVLAPHVAVFLKSIKYRGKITIIDGDTFEPKNTDRGGEAAGSKSGIVFNRIRRSLGLQPPLISEIHSYLTVATIEHCIKEKSIIFSCVDNHSTRKLLSEYAEYLKDVILISGGNDGVEDGKTGTYGNVQIYVREGGKDITAPLTKFHPEIRNPTDENPGEKQVKKEGCEEIAQSAPQVYFANVAAATFMLMAFTRLFFGEERPRVMDELYFDIFEGGSGTGYLTPETAAEELAEISA